MKAVKHTITQKWQTYLYLFLALLAINGCRKNEHVNEETGIANIKKDFLSRSQYQKKLYQPLNDTVQIRWEPQWDETTHTEQNDTITWYYIPLSPELRDKLDVKTCQHVTMDNLKKYILARSTETGIHFSLASYITDMDESELLTESDPSYYGTFTGQLMRENFEDGTSYLENYRQGNPAISSGKNIIANTVSGLSVAKTVPTSSANMVCQYQSVCQWSGVGSDNISNVRVTWGTWQSSRLTDCEYPIRQSVSDPSTWTRSFSYFDERCEIVDNLDPTPTWPPLPPGGGGSSGNSPQGMLKDRLANNPFALLPSYVPCETIRHWLATAKLQVAKAQLDKLGEIVRTTTTRAGITTQTVAQLQDINEAYSTVVNMDYFSVTVNKLPVVNGHLLSAAGFLAHIRKNINNFVDTDYSEFEPYQWYGKDETELWNSTNPLGAVIAIDIQGPDNGSVIVSRHTSNRWTFSTIFDPHYGQHPVSGHRDFGYTLNIDGSYTFYTRGVDRLTSAESAILQSNNFLSFVAGGSPLSRADALWRSFQEKINNFVNANNGSSSVENPQIHRPHWSQVKDVLDGKAPLSTLSKDCPN